MHHPHTVERDDLAFYTVIQVWLKVVKKVRILDDVVRNNKRTQGDIYRGAVSMQPHRQSEAIFRELVYKTCVEIHFREYIYNVC